MSVEAQVYPFKLFSLFTDGTIKSDAIYPVKETITCATAGQLTVANAKGTIQTGTLFVYPLGHFGDETVAIKGTYASGTFTATTASDLVANTKYEVGYFLSRSEGINAISFKNSSLPKDYTITMETLDKDDQGVLTPFYIKVYKATIQRSWELSFNSEGDPATVTMTFDVLEDADGNMIDMIELTADTQQ